MTASDFARRVKAVGMRGLSVQAARLVLVQGLGLNEAARQVGVNKGPASRATTRIGSIKLCQTCGQAVEARGNEHSGK